ncbi:MAG: hypothetical protein Q3996_00580 [Candidatus Saccharibacteria bacterium]|nr:hypothetical protein [Candidatus Saccharibacteria bacterium]
MENEENLYSKEFIERLNNQTLTAKPEAKTSKIGFLIAVGAAALLIIVAFLAISTFISNKAKAKITLINELNVASVQSHDLTAQYQDKINNVKIRVINKNFFQSLLGLNNDLTEYTTKNYDKNQQASLAEAMTTQKTDFANTVSRLYNAEISETLARSYLQELSSLLNKILNHLEKAINSRVYDKEFTNKLTTHYNKLLEIKKSIQSLETENSNSGANSNSAAN